MKDNIPKVTGPNNWGAPRVVGSGGYGERGGAKISSGGGGKSASTPKAPRGGAPATLKKSIPYRG